MTVKCEGQGTCTVTGEVVKPHAPHSIEVRCGTRVASDCEPCSKLYRQDARAVIYSGMDPLKPHTFVTVTAPSFGRTHYISKKNDRKGTKRAVVPTKCPCGKTHGRDSDLLGVPLNLDTYDYDGAVKWNQAAGTLFNRLRTRLARRLETGVEYVKVVEWQARGSVHFHIIFRGAIAESIIKEEVANLSLEDGTRFGPQVDAQLIPAGAEKAHEGNRARRGGYLAKVVTYAVKDLEKSQKTQVAHFARLAQAAQELTHMRKVVLYDNYTPEQISALVEDYSNFNSAEGLRYGHLECNHFINHDVKSDCRSARHRQLGWRGHTLSSSRNWGTTNFTQERAKRAEFMKHQNCDHETGYCVQESAWMKEKREQGHVWGYDSMVINLPALEPIK